MESQAEIRESCCLPPAKPGGIRLTVGFDNLTRQSGPATLSDVPEGKMRIGAQPLPAPAAELKVCQIADEIARSSVESQRLSALID